MPIPTDYKELIAAIHKATDEGRVKWKRHQYEYVVDMSDARIMVNSGRDSVQGVVFAGFALYGEDNQLLDGWAVDDGDNDFDTMDLLVKGAKRCVLEVPSKLETLKQRFLNAPSIGDDIAAGEKTAGRYGT